MKILPLLLVTLTFHLSAHVGFSEESDQIGSIFRPLKIESFVPETVKGLSYKEGDHSWSGGWYSNADAAAGEVDSNSSSTLFSRINDQAPNSASKVAKLLCDALVKEFELPTEPHATAHNYVSGEATDRLGKAFIRVREKSEVQGREYRWEYLVIHVNQQPEGDFLVNMVYTSIIR